MSTGPDNTRQALRSRRRQLGIGSQIASSRRLAQTISQQTIYNFSQHIAFYLPNDGEISLWPLLKHSWVLQKKCYLPVISGRQLQFMNFMPGSPLTRNQFGILEPTAGRYRKLTHIDLVLVPLVAFDRLGNRLGMGGGFYDRTFASQLGKKRPVLWGVAHWFQQVADLTPQVWDFSLDSVITG